MNLKVLECRTAPVKMTHYNIELEGNSTVKSKKTKAYDYYICDYCKEKIILTKKADERTGGIIKIPIRPFKGLSLALCNNCLKPALQEVNKVYETSF